MMILENIIKFVRENQTEFLDLLKNTVNLESYIYGEKEIKDKCGLYIEYLFQSIGFETWHVSGKEAGTHICGKLGEGEKKIFLLGHYDTVFPLGTTKERPFKIEGDKAFGPGIFDMKGGIISFYMAMKTLIELNYFTDDTQVIFFFSCDEEGGSISSREMIEQMAKTAKACLVTEPGHKGEGYITSSRYGRDVVKITARGVAGHAGNHPEENPLVEIARQALYINENCQNGEFLHSSLVSIHGGEVGATAMTPEEAYLIVDIRYKDDIYGEMASNVIKDIKPTIENIKIEISGGVEKPPLKQSEHTKATCDRAKAIIEEMGYSYLPKCLGGGSDGNFTSSIGCPTIDGLGLNGEFLHNPREYIYIPTIPQRVALVAELIRTL